MTIAGQSILRGLREALAYARDEPNGCTTYRYVPHHLIEQYEADGWEVVNDMADCHHGHHSVLMRDNGGGGG